MVNLWPGIPAECLCDRHLNAAINEGINLLIRYHMKKGHKIDGWINNGCVDLCTLASRITVLIEESKIRGKNWKYELTNDDRQLIDDYEMLYLYLSKPMRNQEAILNNHNKLLVRCIKCQKKFIDTNE